MNSQCAEPASADATTVLYPHNIELEQGLLGALLINNAVYERIADITESHHFFDPLHARIYDTATARIKAGMLASPLTLKPLFESWEPIEPGLPVWKYLGKLAAVGSSPANARDYAQALRTLATRRALVALGEGLVRSARIETEVEPKVLIEHVEQAVYALSDKADRTDVVFRFGDALSTVVTHAEAAFQAGGNRPSGLLSGLTDLDRKTGGFEPGNLIIVAGRPSMGKTALALTIAFGVADRWRTSGGRDGAPVQFDSMEMTANELALRVLSGQVGIQGNKIKRGDVTLEQSMAVHTTAARIADTPLFIDQTGGLTISQLAARARRLKRQKGIGLLVVDYLQLMAGAGQENRTQELTSITTGLKSLAKELEIPVIALSQLSRSVEKRDDKRPQLSDLRESGSIEQDADIVLFVYRAEYYIEREQPDPADYARYVEWQAKLRSVEGMAEIVIGKQRSGATGIVPVAFDGATTRFSNLAREAAAHG